MARHGHDQSAAAHEPEHFRRSELRKDPVCGVSLDPDRTNTQLRIGEWGERISGNRAGAKFRAGGNLKLRVEHRGAS